MLRHLWPDLRSGLRMLMRHPTLSVAAILTFGLGMGLATAVFNVANGVLFHGLPFEHGDRIVLVAGTDSARGLDLGGVAVHDYVEFEQRQRVFESMGAFTWVSTVLAWDQHHPERFSGAAMTVGAMRTLGVTPAFGRLFRDGEDRPGVAPVLLLGYRVWRDRFEGTSSVLGQTVSVNGVARTIVGVMPEGFGFPNQEQVWIPLEIDPLATPRGEGPQYEVVARLKPDASIATAQDQLGDMAARLAREHPATNRTVSVVVLPFLERVFGSRLRIMFRAMLGVGIGVLLIACVNVSNLLLARASLRQHEVAVRQALGAGRGRVLSQMLTEVSILAVAGAVLGLAIDVGAMRWFVAATRSTPPPFFVDFDIDANVLLYVAAVTCLATLAAGLVPAWRATRLDLVSTLADEGHGASSLRIGRTSTTLVVAEIAVSCALLIAAGLMVKTVVQVKTADLPFAVDDVLTAWIDLPDTRYPDGAGRARLIEELLPRLGARAGVDAAAVADGLPADGSEAVPVQLWNRPDANGDVLTARRGRVTPGYFETFQATVVRGREFTVFDQPGREMVAVVNESFRRRFFPGVDPIGQRFREGSSDANLPWLTVVGVVPDLLMQGFRNDRGGGAGFYVPIAQATIGEYAVIAVRARRGATVTATVREPVASVDPGLAVYGARSMRAVVDQQMLFYEVFGVLFSALGGAGLLLAAAGLYGVVSFSVTRRARELAIRTALGARRGQLVRLVMRKAATQAVVGLTLGLAFGLLAAGPLRPVLFQVNPRDPAVLATVVVTLAATSLLAGLLGVRRVMSLDPAAALGKE